MSQSFVQSSMHRCSQHIYSSESAAHTPSCQCFTYSSMELLNSLKRMCKTCDYRNHYLQSTHLNIIFMKSVVQCEPDKMQGRHKNNNCPCCFWGHKCIQIMPRGQSASQNPLVWFYPIYHYSLWQTQCHWFPEELLGSTAEDKQFTGTLPHWTALSACQEPSILYNTCFSHQAAHFLDTITHSIHRTI